MSRQVAAALIFDSHGRVFMQRRSPQRALLANCWDIVGGHLEDGETPEQALRREVTEETGWEIDTIHAVMDPMTWVGDDGHERTEIDYLVSVKGDLNAPSLEPGKHTEWRWIGVSELATIDQDGRYGDRLIRELVELGFTKAQEIGLVPPQTADVSVAKFAAVIAPVIDRIFIRLMVDARSSGRELLAKYGFPRPSPLIEFRAILPERPLTPAERDAILRYVDPAELQQGLIDYQPSGAITVAEDGTVTATEAGRAYYQELWALHQEYADQRFPAVPLLEQVLEATSPGPAFSALYPLYLPSGATDGLRTFAQLAVLRYQRADAHAAAWATQGLTAAQIKALEPGEQRQSIEDDTNRRAGVPYGALSPQERFDLLATLARL